MNEYSNPTLYDNPLHFCRGRRHRRASQATRRAAKFYEAAARRGDVHAAAVWEHAMRIRDRLVTHLEFIGGEPRKLHADKGTTRLGGILERRKNAWRHTGEAFERFIPGTPFERIWNHAHDIYLRAFFKLCGRRQGVA